MFQYIYSGCFLLCLKNGERKYNMFNSYIIRITTSDQSVVRGKLICNTCTLWITTKYLIRLMCVSIWFTIYMIGLNQLKLLRYHNNSAAVSVRFEFTSDILWKACTLTNLHLLTQNVKNYMVVCKIFCLKQSQMYKTTWEYMCHLAHPLESSSGLRRWVPTVTWPPTNSYPLPTWTRCVFGRFCALLSASIPPQITQVPGLKTSSTQWSKLLCCHQQHQPPCKVRSRYIYLINLNLF